MSKAIKAAMSGVLSLLFFLVLWAVANIVGSGITNRTFHQVLSFINNSFLVIVLMSILFMIGEIFNSWIFPFNIPYPVFNAFASVFLFSFMKNILLFIDELVGHNIFGFVEAWFPDIYYLVFWVALIVGFIRILFGVIRDNRAWKKDKERKATPWEDVLGDLKKDFKESMGSLGDSLKKIGGGTEKKEGKAKRGKGSKKLKDFE